MDDEVLVRLEDVERWFATLAEPVLLIDAGGVLFNNAIEDSAFIVEVATEFSVDPSELLAHYTAADASFETNHVCVHRVLARCLERLGSETLDASAFTRIDEIYAASVVPNPDMFALLQQARDRGRMLVLTNNEAEHWDRIKHAAFGVFDRFDHVASSWKLGACKPTPEYFERLDRLLLCPRSRWRLLDDNPDVIASARAAGVAATRYDVPFTREHR